MILSHFSEITSSRKKQCVVCQDNAMILSSASAETVAHTSEYLDVNIEEVLLIGERAIARLMREH